MHFFSSASVATRATPFCRAGTDTPRMQQTHADPAGTNPNATAGSEEGMGTPVVSLDGFFALEPELPERVRAEVEAAAEVRRGVQDEEEYWTRLSSGVLAGDVVGDLSKVQEEFRDYAEHWVRFRGNNDRNVDVIGDFQQHMKNREARVQRRVDAHEKRTAAARLKLQAMQAYTNDNNGSPGDARNAHRAQMNALAAERRKQEDAAMFAEVPAPTLPFDPNAGLAILEVLEQPLRKITDDIITGADAIPTIGAEDRQLCIQGYNHLIESFMTNVAMRRKYGYSRADHTAAPLTAGGDVPSYFANVSDGSIFRRKVLSMAGLRNLVIYGAPIYQQLREVHFAGDLEQHKGDRGLGLMRRVTGNVVDLDTTVLRCNDRATLDAINALNKHKKDPTHRDSGAFGKSAQANEIAVNCAMPLLEEFAKAMKLNTVEQRKKRHIDPSQLTTPLHVAQNNTDRGKYPVWHYVNAGQDSFHANVPTMADVNGALLKAPIHCLRCWLQIHALFSGDELARRVEDFFEHCVVDSCFNGKWKAIEEYVHKMAKEGTIIDVLQRAQMKHQAIFTADFFDADNDAQDNEVAEMLKIVRGLVAKEAKSGVMREITEDDVRAWVADPAVEI